MFASKFFTILCVFFFAFAPSTCLGFSLTAILTRRGKPTSKAAPSQSLLDFNAQMAAIVAEERRDHYYPYVQQTSAFLPVKNEQQEETTSSSSS